MLSVLMAALSVLIALSEYANSVLSLYVKLVECVVY